MSTGDGEFDVVGCRWEEEVQGLTRKAEVQRLLRRCSG
jgi:hypothetical protein